MRIMWAVLLLGVFWVAPALAEKTERWIVYYTDKEAPEAFLPYDVIAFDRHHHPPLRPLQNRGKTVLGYISLGEAEKYRDDFELLKSKGIILGENPYWEGHYVIDVRNPLWTKYVIEELIPPMIHDGFDGIMMDTVDSVVALEQNDPEAYGGMKEGAVQLIRAIRMHYPYLKLMLNRGFDILPLVEQEIDMVLAESIMVDFHTDKKVAKLFDDSTYQWYLKVLKDSLARANHLKVYTLDYWDMADVEGVKHIYATQRSHGFIPYVSTIDLQQITPEPQ